MYAYFNRTCVPRVRRLNPFGGAISPCRPMSKKSDLSMKKLPEKGMSLEPRSVRLGWFSAVKISTLSVRRGEEKKNRRRREYKTIRT